MANVCIKKSYGIDAIKKLPLRLKYNIVEQVIKTTIKVTSFLETLFLSIRLKKSPKINKVDKL